MRRRNNYNRKRSNEKKERWIMLGSAVFVLTALTMTGFYVKESSNKEKNDGYTIDFTALENSAGNKSTEIEEQTVPADTKKDTKTEAGNQTAKAEIQKDLSMDDFMDYIPPTGTDSKDIKNSESQSGEEEEAEPEYAQAAEFAQLEGEDSVATGTDSVKNVAQPSLSFSEEDGLTWPIVGNVLINYSMDKTTYFATLEQYKYSPAIVISAAEGATISAAAEGRVIEIVNDEEIGNAIVMDLGSGYQLTYGQLQDIQVSRGSYVKTGDIIGSVAAPTKYYSVEGSNVYFKLTKDGTPVNPMGSLNE